MNCFQEKLQAFATEFERAARKVYESKEVSRLDIEVLQGKMRKMYDFLLSSDFDDTKEQKIETPIEQTETKKEISETPFQPSETKTESAPVKEEEIQLVTEPVEIVSIEVETPKEEVAEPVLEIKTEEPQKQVTQIEVASQTEDKPNEVKEVEIPVPEPQKEEIPVKQEPVVEPKVEVAAPKEQPQEEKSSRSSVLSYLHNNIMKDSEEKPKVETATLDLFSEKPQSIAEQFENRNRSDLRTAIGVSEKFMFINDLFSGNLKEYTDFINQLNDMTTWETSKEVIEQTKQRKKWASASLAYTTLENLIQRRFNK